MGAVTAGLAAGGALLGYLQSRDQRRAAERAAQNASQPQNFFDVTQRQPYGPTVPMLEDLLGRAFRASRGGLPDFPDFQGFGFTGFPTPDIDVSALPTPDIPGASATSDQILASILGLTEESPFLDPLAALFPDLLAGTANQYTPLLLAQATSGPLADFAAGRANVNPFEQQVIGSLEEEFQRNLERALAEAEANASGIGRGGSGTALANQRRDITAEALGDFAPLIAGLRAEDFRTSQANQLSALGQQSSIFDALASQRQNELLTALGLGPSLEQARFLGLDTAGDLSRAIDALNQQASMFEGEFGRLENARMIADTMGLAQFGAGQNQLEALFGQALAESQNAYNMQRFGFDLEAPWFNLNNLAGLLLPIASEFGTTTRRGQTQQTQFPAYTPSSLSSIFSGGFGGLLLGLGMGGFGGGGGGGFSPSQQQQLLRFFSTPGSGF